MNEALCSILCGEEQWKFSDMVNLFLRFNKDSTGELWCCVDHMYYILAQLEWKSLSSPQPEQVETAGATGSRSPQLLGQLNLEITLSKKMVERIRGSNLPADYNEIFVSDDAFRPKVFTVRIEKGNFIAPDEIGRSSKYTTKTRYALRLLFDKSPYPPREEWKEPEKGPDCNLFWDMVEFVGRPSPELQKKMRMAMNEVDSASWGSCVVT